jgi:hypothetical protein
MCVCMYVYAYVYFGSVADSVEEGAGGPRHTYSMCVYAWMCMNLSTLEVRSTQVVKVA